MTPAGWLLLIFMGQSRAGGPAVLPFASEAACRTAYGQMIQETQERRARVNREQRGEGAGPGYSYGRCFNSQTGQMVTLDGPTAPP